jgi:glycosyltransferase involved in cell wall biosynthesis
MVTPRFLPHIGGVERYVQMLSCALVERGVDVTVATTDPTRSLPSREHVSGVEVIRVAAWPKRRDYYFAPELAKIVRDGSWHVVHVQSYHTLVAPNAMLAARRAKIPYALTFHGGGHSSRVRRAIRRPQRALLRPLLETADRLVALAKFEIELYGRSFRLPRDRFVHIPVGTDFVRFRGPAPAVEPEPGLIVSVGRLERYKGHHRLIEALPAIVESRPDARVWIAGSGPYERHLRRIVERLGVADRVEIGAVPVDEPQQMADRLGRAALVVLLSDYETQPSAVLEALALARPVLVTRNTGLAELADHGLVTAIPDSSGRAEVAAAVVEQLRNPFIPARVELPTWQECAARHHDLYLELTRG